MCLRVSEGISDFAKMSPQLPAISLRWQSSFGTQKKQDTVRRFADEVVLPLKRYHAFHLCFVMGISMLLRNTSLNE